MSNYLVRTGRQTVDLPFGASYLGRSGECRIRLEEGLVSRRHARLDVEVDAVFIEDLGSVNGTYVNGELLTGRRRLSPGDVVAIGSEELVLEHADAWRSRRSTKTPGLGLITDRLPSASVSPPARDDRGERSPEDEPTLIAAPTPRPRRSMGLFMVELVEKSITLGKHEEASRLVKMLADSLARMAPEQASETDRARSFVDLSLRLAQASGQWVHVDRVFEVAAQRRWPMQEGWCAAVEALAGTMRPVRGPGLVAYLHVMEQTAAGDPELARRLERLRAAVTRRAT